MGIMKHFIGQEHLLIDDKVCSRCFGDKAIKDFIIANSELEDCKFCNRKNLKVCDLGEVIDFINGCLHKEFTDPNNGGVGWNGREGGWVGATIYDSHEILEEVGLDADGDLFEEIANNLPNEQWCKRDPYGLEEHEELRYDWESFCRFVKHKCRYLFLNTGTTKKGDPLYEREVFLAYILNHLNQNFVSFKLLKKLKKGTTFYRARYFDPQKPFPIDGKNLGPPPEQFASSSRLSAAGIPVFYAATDLETCLAELKIEKPSQAAVMKFELLEDIWIVDFNRLPPIPSIFDEYDFMERSNLKFLHSFLRDLTKLIDKDGKEHVEYVPSQVISENIRYNLNKGKSSIQGIAYPSSVKRGATSYCLYFSEEQCSWYKDGIIKKKAYLGVVSGSSKLI